jgi:hypothetical protein
MMPEDAMRRVASCVTFESVVNEARGTVTLETKGLDQLRRPNFQMIGVPAEYADVARRYMLELAVYTLAVRKIGGDETIGVPAAAGYNFVRVVEVESIAGPRRSLFRRVKTLRLIPPERGRAHDETPLLALATEALEEAHRHARRGEFEDAVRLAQASIELYPGRPGAPSQPDYNTENHWSYDLLFELTGDDRYAAQALERCAAFAEDQLGASLETLNRCPTGRDLLAAAEHIRRAIVENHARRGIVPTGNLIVVTSPLIREGPTSKRELATSMVPKQYLTLLYEGAARRRLDEPSTAALAAQALDTHRSRPGLLRKLVRVPRTDWLMTRVGEPRELRDEDYLGFEYLISGLVCEIARCAAAGCSDDEIRSYLQLESSGHARKGAEEKLNALLGTANEWIDRALDPLARWKSQRFSE